MVWDLLPLKLWNIAVGVIPVCDPLFLVHRRIEHGFTCKGDLDIYG
jgi:hypothetical protein